MYFSCNYFQLDILDAEIQFIPDIDLEEVDQNSALNVRATIIGKFTDINFWKRYLGNVIFSTLLWSSNIMGKMNVFLYCAT